MKMLIYIAVLFLAYHLFCLLWIVVTDRRSIRYTGVTAQGLREHLEQFLRRAYRGATLHVEHEASEKSLRIQKWYEYKQVGHDAYLVFDGFTRSTPKADEFRKELRRKRKKCDYGIARSRRLRDILACKCKGDLDGVLDLIKEAFDDLYGVPQDATFTVFVKGGMENADIVRDAQTCKHVSRWATMSGCWGKPYLKKQIPGGPFHWVGRALGRLVSEIERVFFPRNPEDDLKK